MTEQMKQSLDQAAKGLQWSNGQILLNKENFKPADPAVTPLNKLVSVPIPDKLETAVKFGVNWYLNNVWHDAKTEDPDEEKQLILLNHLNNGEASYRFALYSDHARTVMVSNNGAYPWMKLSYYEKWAYVDDFFPDISK